MGVLLGEAAYGGGVVSGSEIVGAGFGIQVFPAVAEGGCPENRGPFRCQRRHRTGLWCRLDLLL